MAFYYLRTFGHSQSGQKRLRSRFIAAADCDYRDDIRGCHSPKRDDVQVDHEIPSRDQLPPGGICFQVWGRSHLRRTVGSGLWL